mmetsp:Transcript_60200/g.134119  ORF Transcript_60200/g.134119 Transcript_60200/m.134119 type:complete len:92 (-) Transcript_60200:331-606(-)
MLSKLMARMDAVDPALRHVKLLCIVKRIPTTAPNDRVARRFMLPCHCRAFLRLYPPSGVSSRERQAQLPVIIRPRGFRGCGCGMRLRLSSR